MSALHKSTTEAKELGLSLRLRRNRLGFTLKNLEMELGVDAGQISRFERGDFKIVSKNLQKVIDFLQASEATHTGPPELVVRFSELIQRSQRHVAAARALLSVLEILE